MGIVAGDIVRVLPDCRVDVSQAGKVTVRSNHNYTTDNDLRGLFARRILTNGCNKKHLYFIGILLPQRAL